MSLIILAGTDVLSVFGIMDRCEGAWDWFAWGNLDWSAWNGLALDAWGH